MHPQSSAESFDAKEAKIQLENGNIALDSLMDCFEKDMLLKALEKSRGSRTKAAKLLGISCRSVRYRLKKHGIGGAEDHEDDFSEALDETGEQDLGRLEAKDRLA